MRVLPFVEDALAPLLFPLYPLQTYLKVFLSRTPCVHLVYSVPRTSQAKRDTRFGVNPFYRFMHTVDDLGLSTS